MSRSGAIYIRADASPEQCRAIAAAVECWYRRKFDRLRLAWIDQMALNALADGHLPCVESDHSPRLDPVQFRRGRMLGDEGQRYGVRVLCWAQCASGDGREALRTVRRVVEDPGRVWVEWE